MAQAEQPSTTHAINNATSGPDARLLALCAEYEAAQRRLNGLWRQGRKIMEGPNYIANDDDREAVSAPLEQAQDELLQLIISIQAATPKGWQAKARCLLLMDGETRDLANGDFEHNPFERDTVELLLGSLLHDLTGDEITNLTCADTPLHLVGQAPA